MTEFKPGRKPRVRIGAALAYDDLRQFATVQLSATNTVTSVFMAVCSRWSPRSRDLFDERVQSGGERIQARQHHQRPQERLDGVASRLRLRCAADADLPFSARRVGLPAKLTRYTAGFLPGTLYATDLIEKVRREFQCRPTLLCVRLLQHGYIQSQAQGQSLFA